MRREHPSIVLLLISRRATLFALACLSLGALSCARQQSRTTPQPEPSSAVQTAQRPSPQAPASQPQAAIVVAPAPPDQAQFAAAQPPDRILNSGHTAAVTAVSFSPDRRFAATGSEDKTIRLWDLSTAAELRVLTGHTQRIEALAFSPDGTRLASASNDGTVRVWDPSTANLVYSFTLPSKFVEQVAFSPDGQILAASAGADDEGGNSYIGLHDAATGAQIRTLTLDWNSAAPLAITPDRRLLSSGGAGEDGEYVSAKIWDLPAGGELKTLQALFNAISPDGRWGASLQYRQPPPQSPSTDRLRIDLWDIALGRQVRAIDLHAFDAAHVVFTPDGTRILAVTRNGQNPPQGKFFDVATGREVQTLPIPAGADAFSSDGKWLAAASGNSVGIWDLAAGRQIETLAGQLAADDLAFTPDGKLLVSGGSRGGAALCIWDVASGKLQRTVAGATQSLALSSEGRWLATNLQGNLEIWDTSTWTRATPSPPTGQFVWWFGFASSQLPPADLSAAGLKWWQIGADSEARLLWGATFATALSPDGKIVATAALRQPAASAYDRPNISIWDVATGRLLQTFEAHLAVSVVAFSPDGRWLATTGQDSRLDPANLGASLAGMKRSLKLWDTSTWRLHASLQFVGPVSGGLGKFSPDSRLLALASQNGVTLYDVPDLRAIKTLSGGGGAVRFSPDGHWLARGAGAGIALWNLAEVSR